MTNRKVPKSQKQYVRGIIHNLSLQRWTSQEIADFLHEKNIMIARRTVSQIRTATEKSAEKWYIELRQSRYKYIAHFKERIDSLLSYQKQLHEIIASSKKDEVKIRAISELTSIEMNIFSLWKQLPDLDIVDRAKLQQQQQQQQQDEYNGIPPILEGEDLDGIEQEPSNPWHDYYKCDGCKRWWRNQELRDYHRKKCTNPNSECSLYNYKENIQ